MIHELIDPKKKTNKASSASKNTKIFQEPKTISEEINLEISDSENKESSSTIFIPPWLRNSLGLNQRNNLRNATGSSDVKSTKPIQRGKESSQNEFESLKGNVIEQVSCKKVAEHFEILPQDCPREENIARGSDDLDAVDNSNERTIPIYWDVRCKDSETEWSCTNADAKPLKKEDPKMISTEVLTSADIEKLKEEDKKRLKFIKQKNKLRKRIMSDAKQSEMDNNEMDFLLEMKAREALDSYMKGDVHSVSSEMRHLEAKLLLLSAKSHDLSGSRLNPQDFRMLREVKNQAGSVEQLERVFEHVKDVNLRGVIRNSEFASKNLMEKKREDKEEKCMREVMQNDGKCKADKDSLLSTDDENDIKRFSEFLSKNKNLDEKRKCLEEVRNYFERKRRTRLTKRRFAEEGKAKLNFQAELGKEEHAKEKAKSREMYRGRRSKFALCDEEVVEKAVDEALQKFVELYHFRVSPSVMGNMKKNILQAIATDSPDNAKLKESASVALGSTKINLDLLNLPERESEKGEAHPYLEAEITEVPNKDSVLQKEVKRKNVKNESSKDEQASKLASEADVMENEKLKRLKKEFDIFLNSVQTHIDVTDLKLQSIILEKEEQTASTQNVQFVYNFTKKALEPEKADYWQSLKEVLDLKNRKDIETQTIHAEPGKRNVKIQALELRASCEQGLQTEAKVCVTQDTQTEGEGPTVREIKELRSYDVHPGLYRMVRSKEAGKFYLYPEQPEDGKSEVCEKSNSSVARDKKLKKRRNLANVLSKEGTKERHVFFREREKAKPRKSKRTPAHAVAQVKGASTRKRKKDETSENSISCLYFRNFDKKGSDSSKKEVDLTDENPTGGAEEAEDLSLGQPTNEHVGCFWFWDGERISPGCDLKTHVETLLKERLTQIANVGGNQNEFGEKASAPPKDDSQDRLLRGDAPERNAEAKNANAAFSFGGAPAARQENEAPEQRKEKKEEICETDENFTCAPQEKPVKNVATQDSHLKLLSLNLSKYKTPCGAGATVRRKCTRRNIVIRPAHGKVVNIRKAQDFLRAVEEIKKTRLELANSKKGNSTDSESLLECSTSTSCYKNPAEDPLSVVLGLKEIEEISNPGPEIEEISNSEIKNKIKKFMSLVDREVQTTDLYDAEDANSVESQGIAPSLDNQKHLDLIGHVLSRVGQRQREHLWNDVRHFIKTKIGKDINDEGTREVCIEIEQDVPKAEQGKVKHSVLAKGHYSKNEGDVEVEIDLTLEDLARILRQRQKRIRRRNMYRSSRSKNFLSSSSAQSDLTRDDIRRYQRYLHRFAALGHGLSSEKDSKAFKKNKGN